MLGPTVFCASIILRVCNTFFARSLAGNGGLIKLLNSSCRIHLKNTNDALVCVRPIVFAIYVTLVSHHCADTYHDFVGRIVQTPKCSLAMLMTMIICCNCAFSFVSLFPAYLFFSVVFCLFVRV